MFDVVLFSGAALLFMLAIIGLVSVAASDTVERLLPLWLIHTLTCVLAGALAFGLAWLLGA